MPASVPNQVASVNLPSSLRVQQQLHQAAPVKKNLSPFAIPVFCYLFFLPYRFTGDCDYSNKYNIFSIIVNNILHNITTQLKYYQR